MTYDDRDYERIGTDRLRCKLCDYRIGNNTYAKAAHSRSKLHLQKWSENQARLRWQEEDAL